MKIYSEFPKLTNGSHDGKSFGKVRSGQANRKRHKISGKDGVEYNKTNNQLVLDPLANTEQFSICKNEIKFSQPLIFKLAFDNQGILWANI